jgi:hypothetical protein
VGAPLDVRIPGNEDTDAHTHTCIWLLG